MDHFLGISVSLASKAVTFFIGTGFSKYITDGKAPNWIELIIELTFRIDTKYKTLQNKLLNKDETGVLSPKYELSICAQILELEYKKNGYDIRLTVAQIIKDSINDTTINTNKIQLMKDFFNKYPDINIITTYFDTLFSEYILKGRSKVFIDGFPIPKSNVGQNIYHIHGCIVKPSSIVLTISDYFKYQHKATYLSRKFYTLLQETTVVIMGYSLGDFNLNRIFNEAQINKAISLRRSDIYLVDRDPVDEIFEKYYSFSYGIQVIDFTEIDELLSKIENKIEDAKKLLSETENLLNVLNGAHTYPDDFIKLGTSFSNILLQASTLNIDPMDKRLIKVLIDILKKKESFTQKPGAWSQYAQFAEWLIDLGSLIDIDGCNIED